MTKLAFPPPACLDEMTTPQVLEAVLNGPLASWSGPTRVLHLASLRAVALALDTRQQARPLPWLSKALNRIKQREGRRNQWDRVLERDEYLKAAEALHRTALGTPGISDLARALMVRDAAQIALHADISPRRSEAAGICINAVSEVASGMSARIRARDSKTNTPQLRRLDPRCAVIVKDYLCKWRGVLAARRKSAGEEHSLWLGRDGRPLTATALDARLRQPLQRLVGRPASANVFRRAAASRSDVRDTERADLLGQAPNSPVAASTYRRRSRTAACAQIRVVLAKNLR